MILITRKKIKSLNIYRKNNYAPQFFILMKNVTANSIEEFQIEILSWHEKNGRHLLPWRSEGLSNYELIIAEILLQRTKAETVANFYHLFLKAFSSWKSLAMAEIEEIENILKPIGLYKQRASRLKKLAVEMIKRKQKLPNNRDELESIPFMGQYIANAVELLIFNKPVQLLDVNMARVIERYFGERKLSDIRYDPYLQALSLKIVNHNKSRDLNWAILDFAALVCKARNPDCEHCPISQKCLFYNKIK